MEKKKEDKPAKKASKKILKKAAPHEHAFMLCTGVAVNSVKQLADELDLVDDAVYYFHTNNRNDFAQWVQDVFGNDKLAEKIRNAHSRECMRAAIYRHLLEE